MSFKEDEVIKSKKIKRFLKALQPCICHQDILCLHCIEFEFDSVHLNLKLLPHKKEFPGTPFGIHAWHLSMFCHYCEWRGHCQLRVGSPASVCVCVREREVELLRACSFITAPSGVTVLKRLVSVRAAPVGTCPPIFFALCVVLLLFTLCLDVRRW